MDAAYRVRTKESPYVARHTPSPRHPTKRQKAVAVLLARADANFHAILRRADPAILSSTPGDAAPVPVPAVVAAINHAGQWPPHILHSSRLPRTLTHIRQTTALLALQLCAGPASVIAHELGRLNRSSIMLAAASARQRLAHGEHATLDLFAAALVTLQDDHPGSPGRLDDDLRDLFGETLQRHQAPPSTPSPGL